MTGHTKLPDIVELLQKAAGVRSDTDAWLMVRGADEIERLRTSSIGWEEAREAAAKVADETAALEDKHDRYEAWRAAHDIAQTIRSLPRPPAPAEDRAMEAARRIMERFRNMGSSFHDDASIVARALLSHPAPAKDGLREALEEVKTFLTPALPYPERDRLYAVVCAALSSGREWQPIQTLPRDGTTVKLRGEMLAHHMKGCKFSMLPPDWRPETPQTEWRVTGWQEVPTSTDQPVDAISSGRDGRKT